MIARVRAAGRVAWRQLRMGRRALLLACSIGALLALGRCVELLSLADAVGGEGASLGDCLAFVVMGSSQPSPAPSTVSLPISLRVPYAWLVLVLTPSALVAQAGGEDVGGLVASGERMAHWAGRCASCLFECVLYWLVVLGCCAAFSALVGLDSSLAPSSWLPDAAGLSRETLPGPPYEAVSPFASACAMSCALMLAQLALSESIGVRMGFSLVAAVVAGSVFSMTPVLLGNFMMAARSTVFVVPYQVESDGGLLRAGLSPGMGVVVACVLAVVSVVVGAAVAARKEYLGSVQR